MKPIVYVILLIVVCGGVPAASAAGAPVAVDDHSGPCFWNDEGFYLSTWGPGLLDNDYDPAGLPLSAELVSAPSHGLLKYFDSDGEFMYVADPYFLGDDSFTYRVWNGIQYSEPACVTMPVWKYYNPPYYAPEASADAYTTTVDTMLSVPAPGILENDQFYMCPHFYPACVDPHWAVLIEEPGHGSLILQDDGSFTYTPDPGFTGTDSFWYVAEHIDERNDRGHCFSEYTQVTITVNDSVPPVPEFPGHVLVIPGIILGLFGIAVRMRGRR